MPINNLMTHIELEISNPCNERCLHCYRGCNSTRKGFLSAAQTKNVLKQAKNLGVKSVTITGGEALLNPEWREIVEIADDLDYQTSLFTNGSLLNEKDMDFLSSVKN